MTESKLWVEKYRPKTISDVESQEEIVKILSKSISTGDLPHLLFYGPAGSGKSSSIIALARDLFKDSYKERVLELNASDERGIQVIREKVKNFASTSINTQNSSCLFKLIILDEADSMTYDAQSALRRIIEKYTSVTRFCLICNYVSRIIEPLSSRCVKFRFKALPPKNILARLRKISDLEKIKVSDKTLGVLLSKTKGDLRRAITLLQGTSSLNESTSSLNENDETNYTSSITTKDILDCSGSLEPEIITDLWNSIESGSFDNVILSIKDIMSKGLQAPLLILELFKIIALKEIPDSKKSQMMLEISKTDKNLEDSADEEIQLLALVSVIQKILF
jgi:replication factor C subunit 2/4